MFKKKAKIKLLYLGAKTPTKASARDAGYDLYACIENPVTIKPGSCEKIGTGVSITPPEGYFGAIFARSGLAAKQGLRPANCVGVADEPYTGEYIVALYNDSDKEQIIEPGDRIAQLVFLPYLTVEFQEVEELEKTERADGGFGHSGR